MLTKKNCRACLLFGVAAALLLVAIACLITMRQKEPSEQATEPETWIELAPAGIVSADGSPVVSRMRLGGESDKVIVLFYGGGISIDEYTASHPDASCQGLFSFFARILDDRQQHLCTQD